MLLSFGQRFTTTQYILKEMCLNLRLRRRRDLRNLCLFTIDSSTTTDLDDALSVEKLSGNNFKVVAVGHNVGLFNLGNTCYMNPTVQCLYLVPELKLTLISEFNKNIKPVGPMRF